MPNIKPIRYWCYKILPLVYDDSLSYYEVLAKLTAKTNEVIDQVNKWSDLTDELHSLESKVDAHYTELKGNVSSINRQIDAINAEIDDLDNIRTRLSRLEDIYKQLENVITNLRKFIDSIQAYVDSRFDTLDRKFTAKESALYVYINTIDARLQRQIDDLYERLDKAAVDVYNYSANKRLNFDDNNTKLYIDLENAISAQEYCSLGLTADEYKKYEISALDYLRDSKKLLHYDWVYMAISGRRQDVNVALTELADYFFGTMDSSDYTALNLSAEDYANLGLTATGYQQYNPTSTTGDVTGGGNGLTTKQYSTLQMR